jgi:peptidoglycan/LPS O-acetylase OafA/YrhL
LQTFPARCIATLAAAMLSYYFVEKPMIRIGHRIAKRIVRREAAPLAVHTAPS